MPRHPPFALSNLKSHKYQRKDTHNHHPKQRQHSCASRPAEQHPQQGSLFARCSRPLCSSQRTVSPHNTTNTCDATGLKDHPQKTRANTNAFTPFTGLGLHNPTVRTRKNIHPNTPTVPTTTQTCSDVLSTRTKTNISVIKCSTHEQRAENIRS